MSQRYTRREVARIVGADERQLCYWERLRLVRPRARWGQRFYSFGDLLSARSLKQLTSRRVPALRVRRALVAFARQARDFDATMSSLRLAHRGREVVVVPAGQPPFEPLTGQLLLSFDSPAAHSAQSKVRRMASRTAEEWFELGLAWDTHPESYAQAADAYRNALALEPDWVEAHINLGTALYHLWELEEAEEAFRTALRLEALNPTAHFNLGCVLFEQNRLNEAIKALERAVELAPASADAHLNLALACEKAGTAERGRRHWEAYLRLEPLGPWAEYARAQLRPPPARGKLLAKLTPFRRPSGMA